MKNTMFGTIIRTTISYILITFFLICAIPFFLLMICVPEKIRYKNKLIFFFIRWFYKIILWCTLLPIKVYGSEYIPSEPSIFIANHQSALDIPLLGMLCNGDPHIWLARSEVMRMGLMRFILPFFSIIVDLSNVRNAMRSVRNLIYISQETKAHIAMFPEGQRYTDGQVHDFLKGFVILAKKMGRPVVPVCILGVNNAYPSHSFLVRWFPITVIIGKPFIYSSFETDDEFYTQVQEWFFMQTGQKR